MKHYENSRPDLTPARAHPWSVSESDPQSRYYDFASHPRLIRQSLEDFQPWASWPAVETFYRLVEWINGNTSSLESSDCSFSGPSANSSDGSAKALETTGRLIVLWRDLPANLSPERIASFNDAVHSHFDRIDPTFEWGAIGTTVLRSRYVSLALPPEQQLGFQLILSFWSWGDTESEVMDHLDRVFRNIWDVLQAVIHDDVTPLHEALVV